MTFRPQPQTIYLTDNGRALCGDHLGSSARHTGRDISGQPILPLSPENVRYSIDAEGWHPACEHCGKRASLLIHAA
jgi:hypothetical protein